MTTHTQPAPAFLTAPAPLPAPLPHQHLRAVEDYRPGEAGPVQPPAHGIHVDAERRTVHVDGAAVELTYLEFELLAHLVAHPYRVHTRDQLISTVWGYGHAGDGRTVDVHVARLRRKLGEVHRAGIVTVRRVGYKYEPVRSVR
ncbi:hypothetical protein GCM10027168_43380 [Streptomyces capparidis]